MADVVKGEAPELFVRRSSGLVRQLGLRDVFVMNWAWTGNAFSVSLAFMISQALWAYPGADFGVAEIITVVLLVPPIALTYGLLTTVMPRAGGDYVFISRILNPLLGFLANWGIFVMLAFYVAWGAYWGGAQALATVFATLGYTLGSGWLVGASSWIATTPGAFLVALAFIVLFGGIVCAGTRFFKRAIMFIFAVGVIAMIPALVVMGVVSQQTFVAHFNSFMTAFTKNPDYYGTVIRRAHATAGEWSSFSWGATLSVLPIMTFMSIWVFASSYVGGEVRRVQKTQLASSLGALAFLGLSLVVTYYLVRGLTGYEFLTAANVDYFNGTLTELPVAPYFNLFATIATGSPVLQVIISIGYVFLSILFVPVIIMFSTRSVFAWSMDRVLPDGLARVSQRFASPVNAVLFMLAFSVAFLAILSYTTWLSTLGAIEGMLPAVILTCVAGAVLPWRRPGLYRSSPIARWRLGPVPVITILGTWGAIYALVVFAEFLANGRYLVNSRSSLLWILGVFVTGLLVFGVSWAIRRRQGFDLGKVYTEIPPS